MKQTLRPITILFLAGNMLLASTGVSVHHLFCYCKGKSFTSLFCIPDPCESTRCEAKETSESCCKKGKCEQAGDNQNQRDCSDCYSQFVKLDADCLLFPTDFKLHLPDAVPAAFHRAAPLVFSSKTAFLPDAHAPPPPGGRALLRLIQTCLC